MARKLEQFPSAGGARYPWDQWLDGDAWELEYGHDFTSKANTLRANAQLQAKKRGGRVRSRHIVEAGGREVVVLQFIAATRA